MRCDELYKDATDQLYKQHEPCWPIQIKNQQSTDRQASKSVFKENGEAVHMNLSQD